MLTKHEKTPRHRLLAGGAALAGLTLAGLALTASGTAAAEKMRERVELATGVELAALDLPAAIAPLAPISAQVATTALPPSSAPEAPTAPVASAAPEQEKSWTWTQDSGNGKDKKRIVIRRVQGAGLGADGRPRAFILGPDNEQIPMLDDEMLAVREEKCGKQKDGPAEIIRTERDGKRQLMIICADRIAQMAADASKHAEVALADANGARFLALKSRKMGLTSAMMGLRHARTSIEMQDSLSADQKREALAGIDQAIREIEQEQQSPDE